MTGGPSIWRYYKNYKLREYVIKQTVEVLDKSEIKEPALFILKKKYIRKGEFSVIFNADKAGIISIAFKYMNRDNYYIFEIGGHKQDQKFFRLRKRVNGMMNQLKKLNSIDELPKEPFGKKSKLFGYERDVFYRVRIELSKTNIKVFYSKVGKREIMIIDENDEDILYGQVGFGTFLTTASFDNISLRPVVASKSKFKINNKNCWLTRSN